MYWPLVTAFFVVLFGFVAVLIVHVGCAADYRADMDSINKQLDDINWPVGHVQRPIVKRKWRE